MHAHLPAPIGELAQREGIVIVLGIGRVDGERGHVAHIVAAGHLLVGDAGLDALRRALHVGRILIRKAKFGEDGVNLGIVLAGAAQDVLDGADWAVGVLGPLDDAHDGLVASGATRQFVERDKDVGGQELAIGGKHSVVLLHIEGAHKHLLFALHNLDDLGLGLHAGTHRADVHHHAVTVEGVHRVALSNHDGLATRIVVEHHTVLAVAATHENTRRHRARAAHGTEPPGGLLVQEAIGGQMLKNLDNERALTRRRGADGGRHLLVVERSSALGAVKKVDYAVVQVTPLHAIVVIFLLFCHNYSSYGYFTAKIIICFHLSNFFAQKAIMRKKLLYFGFDEQITNDNQEDEDRHNQPFSDDLAARRGFLRWNGRINHLLHGVFVGDSGCRRRDGAAQDPLGGFHLGGQYRRIRVKLEEIVAMLHLFAVEAFAIHLTSLAHLA